MMRVNVLLFGLLIITSCDQFYEYAITYESESDNTINYRDELLTVRYVAWKQCDVGGTLNQVSIRNNSAEPLQIDSLSLSMFIDEIDVIAADSPIVYSADAIASDARVIPFEG